MTITKQFVYDTVLPIVKEKGRILDYYLILNLLEKGKYEYEVQNELREYQNSDFGFGNALEPDCQTPSSSVLATDVAIEIIDTLDSIDKELIREIVKYFESVYDEETKSFPFINEDTSDYPHAIWWSKEGVPSFDYLNPNTEVAGFLYKYREYIEKIDIYDLVKSLISKINEKYDEEVSEHSLYSVIQFYNYLDEKYQTQIEAFINKKTCEIIVLDESKWHDYVAMPYKLIESPEYFLYPKFKKELESNLDFLIEKLLRESILMPEWQWYNPKYDEVFEKKAKFQWMGFYTWKALKMLSQFNKLK